MLNIEGEEKLDSKNEFGNLSPSVKRGEAFNFSEAKPNIDTVEKMNSPTEGIQFFKGISEIKNEVRTEIPKSTENFNYKSPTKKSEVDQIIEKCQGIL